MERVTLSLLKCYKTLLEGLRGTWKRSKFSTLNRQSRQSANKDVKTNFAIKHLVRQHKGLITVYTVTLKVERCLLLTLSTQGLFIIVQNSSKQEVRPRSHRLTYSRTCNAVVRIMDHMISALDILSCVIHLFNYKQTQFMEEKKRFFLKVSPERFAQELVSYFQTLQIII